MSFFLGADPGGSLGLTISLNLRLRRWKYFPLSLHDMRKYGFISGCCSASLFLSSMGSEDIMRGSMLSIDRLVSPFASGYSYVHDYLWWGDRLCSIARLNCWHICCDRCWIFCCGAAALDLLCFFDWWHLKLELLNGWGRNNRCFIWNSPRCRHASYKLKPTAYRLS